MNTGEQIFPTSIERDPDLALNENVAAEMLGISTRTLQSWRVKGTGPRFTKIGRAVRYRRRELLKFLDDRTVSSTSQVIVNSA